MKDFYAWLRRDKYTIILTILCTAIPLLSEIKFDIKSEVIKFLWGHATDIINILFLLVTLIALTGTRFLINRDKKKSGELFAYVKLNFGENCLLFNAGEQKLFRQMSAGVSQFYYSWLLVWGIWLALYTVKFIFEIYCEINKGECILWVFNVCYLEKLKNLIVNSLNLANSVVLFFIYLVITICTIDAKSVEIRQRALHIGVILLIFMTIIIFFVELFSQSLLYSSYTQIQFWIRLLVGIIATVAMVSVIGRLDSSYLCIPQWLIVVMYFYAGVQTFYPLLYAISKYEIYEIVGTKILESLVATISILGKFCLFLMIRWIATQKRFLFYLLQKANSKSESVAMWREFYKQYEGCPDKE